MHANKLWALVALCLLCTAVACPCGGHGKANVKACQEWKVRMSTKMCGATAFPTSIKCESYEEQRCDLSAFFRCLEDHAKCRTVAGVETTDTSGQAQCAKLASCQ